jgi:hypothetical protein
MGKCGVRIQADRLKRNSLCKLSRAVGSEDATRTKSERKHRRLMAKPEAATRQIFLFESSPRRTHFPKVLRGDETRWR